MFTVPPHIHDTTFFCQEAETSLIPFATQEEIASRQQEIKDAYSLSPMEHQTLCENLHRNPETVPWQMQEVFKLYQRAKIALQRSINKRIKKQLSTTRKSIGTPTEYQEKQNLRLLQEAAREGSREFLCQWKPLLEASARCSVMCEAWAEGLREYRDTIRAEMATWNTLHTIEPERQLVLTVTYQDKGSQQIQEFRVSNTTLVSDFAHTVQRRFGISLSLHPREELRFFCSKGPLKNTTTLNQYDSSKISNLKLLKVLLEKETFGSS